MIELNNKEMKNIYGGGMSVGLLVGISAGVTFIIGVIDGIIRPKKCN